MTLSGDHAHVPQQRRKTRQVTIRLTPGDYQEALLLASRLSLSLTAMFTHAMKTYPIERRKR